jgi:hypothetical protein
VNTLGDLIEALRDVFPKAVQSPPPTRDGLLQWARSARELAPGDQREHVLRIVEESLSSPERCSVEDIFDAAYGDPSGRNYWRLWFKFGSEAEFRKLLAAHFVAEKREIADRLLYGRLPDGVCEIALQRYPSGTWTDRVRAIIEDEELDYLIAPSVRAFLQPEITIEPTHRKRGPRESVTPRILREMRNTDRRDLESMTHELMRVTFRAAASTCNKARATVLGKGPVAN